MSDTSKAEILALYAALSGVSLNQYQPGTCVFWSDSKDAVCAASVCDENQWLCTRHLKIAVKRREKAYAKHADRAAKQHKADLDLNLPALRAERDKTAAKRDALHNNTRRHDTDDMAAYMGIGIRQTARQKQNHWNRLSKAAQEYPRLDDKVKELDRKIARAERARTVEQQGGE